MPPIDAYVESCGGDRLSSCRLLIDFFFHSKIFTAFNRRADKATAKRCWALHTIIHTFITASFSVIVVPGSEVGAVGKSGTAMVGMSDSCWALPSYQLYIRRKSRWQRALGQRSRACVPREHRVTGWVIKRSSHSHQSWRWPGRHWHSPPEIRGGDKVGCPVHPQASRVGWNFCPHQLFKNHLR